MPPSKQPWTLDRIMERVVATGECLVWTGTLNEHDRENA